MELVRIVDGSRLHHRDGLISSHTRFYWPIVWKGLFVAKTPSAGPVVDLSVRVGLARIWAGWRESLVIVTPDIVLRCQRRRFREYWTQPSGGSTGGRPPINAEIRALISRIATANPLWDAPRIHGEILKLGIDVADLFLANSEFAVISIHASRTNCRNPSIFRFSNAATKLKPGYSKANVLVRRAEALLSPIRLPDAHHCRASCRYWRLIESATMLLPSI